MPDLEQNYDAPLKRKRIRCAIYTRKSSEEGLDQDFNSLHAQREACAAYVESQKHEGWVLIPNHYDDGGVSGGTLERPGLQKLMHDIDEGLVDQIIVYKIDRLTRSLSDFAKLIDRLEAADASFVSVTQSFNTATSMGRLTLNMLLSFAQFEREVTSERIRDKIAASKKRGLWMGGNVPLGFKAEGRSLTIVENEAETVQTLFQLYRQHQNIRLVKEKADRLGLKTKHNSSARNGNSRFRTSNQFSRGHIQFILSNPIYAGRIRHKQVIHEGLHEAIIDPDEWDEVQQLMQAGSARSRGSSKSEQHSSLLIGKLFDETGDRLTPSHSNKKGRRYRYYVSRRLVTQTKRNAEDTSTEGGWRLPGPELENHLCGSALNVMETKVTSFLCEKTNAEQLQKTMSAIIRLKNGNVTQLNQSISQCIKKVVLGPGFAELEFDRNTVSGLLHIEEKQVSNDPLKFTIPFQTKKRGVETKLVLDNGNPTRVDQTLLKNIANAHHYYEQIQSGTSVQKVADEEGVSTARILKRLELAFLAPDLVQRVAEGKHPIGLTTKWFQNRTLPLDWDQQRQLIGTL